MNTISNQSTRKSPLRSTLLCAIGSALILGAGICVTKAPAFAADLQSTQARIDALKDRNRNSAAGRQTESRMKRLSDRLNALKYGATRPPSSSPGDVAHEELGVGDAGLDARPSRNHGIDNPLESYGNDVADHQDHNDARRPGHGLSNTAKGEALANGSLGRGNLGRPNRGGASSANRGQNNAGQSTDRLLSAIGGGKVGNAGLAGGMQGERVMGDGDKLVSVEYYRYTDDYGEYHVEIHQYESGRVNLTVEEAASGRLLFVMYDAHDDEKREVVYHWSPSPECRQGGGPNCPTGPVPPEAENLIRDLEAEYKNGRLRAAITREHTGQPTPSEGPTGVVDGEGFPGSDYTSGTDRDCLTAKCNNGLELTTGRDQLVKGLQMRRWAPQHAPR